jgi:hypothetical protein
MHRAPATMRSTHSLSCASPSFFTPGLAFSLCAGERAIKTRIPAVIVLPCQVQCHSSKAKEQHTGAGHVLLSC